MTYLADAVKVGATGAETPQSEPLLGTDQRRNSAGGYAFPVDDWTRLDRFLILGSEGGSYYASERTLTKENANAVLRCVAADGARVVRRIVEISDAGRAPKNDPALFALAAAAGKGDDATRRLALEALPKVARIGTHVLHFAAYVEQFRGWGRGLRRAIGRWYTARDAGSAAFQAVKYQARDGWGQRDLLRLAHPKAPSESHRTVFHWMTKGWESVGDAPHPDMALQLIWAFERAKRLTPGAPDSTAELVRLIREYRLPREAVPTAFLKERAVWLALLEADMPATAMLRNLATMTRVGIIAPNTPETEQICAALGRPEWLRHARVHPIQLLSALKVYAQGHGERSNATWTPVTRVIDALDAAFYASFEQLAPTGKRWVLGLDVSGSMDGGVIAGVPGLTPRVASAAMAMVTARTEAAHTMVAFTSPEGVGWYHRPDVYQKKGTQLLVNPDAGLTALTLSPRQRLDDVCKAMAALPMGGTDCALPMLWAAKHKVPADVFVIYTDSETWAGGVHPTRALTLYREQMGIAAKLIVVGMTASEFSIADPNDGGMLDVVGFDSATPALMNGFVTGDV